MKKSKYIDHTQLKAFATKDDILTLISEAKKYDFKSVCVNPYWVSLAHNELKDSDVLTCTVIGFPLGANTKEVKAFEAHNAVLNGADEVDMVINIGLAKAHDYEGVYEDIKAVVDASMGKTVKVILETCYLSKEEIVECSKCATRAQANFVKTSTGFGTGGADACDVKLMKESISPDMEVKASGGIRDKETFEKMIEAGATRIGTSSGAKLI